MPTISQYEQGRMQSELVGTAGPDYSAAETTGAAIGAAKTVMQAQGEAMQARRHAEQNIAAAKGISDFNYGMEKVYQDHTTDPINQKDPTKSGDRFRETASQQLEGVLGSITDPVVKRAVAAHGASAVGEWQRKHFTWSTQQNAQNNIDALDTAMAQNNEVIAMRAKMGDGNAVLSAIADADRAAQAGATAFAPEKRHEMIKASGKNARDTAFQGLADRNPDAAKAFIEDPEQLKYFSATEIKERAAFADGRKEKMKDEHDFQGIVMDAGNNQSLLSKYKDGTLAPIDIHSATDPEMKKQLQIALVKDKPTIPPQVESEMYTQLFKEIAIDSQIRVQKGILGSGVGPGVPTVKFGKHVELKAMLDMQRRLVEAGNKGMSTDHFESLAKPLELAIQAKIEKSDFAPKAQSIFNWGGDNSDAATTLRNVYGTQYQKIQKYVDDLKLPAAEATSAKSELLYAYTRAMRNQPQQDLKTAEATYNSTINEYATNLIPRLSQYATAPNSAITSSGARIPVAPGSTGPTPAHTLTKPDYLLLIDKTTGHLMRVFGAQTPDERAEPASTADWEYYVANKLKPKT